MPLSDRTRYKRAERLQELVENGDVPELAMACQSEMIRYVQEQFGLTSGSGAWTVVNTWKQVYDQSLAKNVQC